MSWFAPIALAAGGAAVAGLLRLGHARFFALSAEMERHDLDYLTRIGWPATHPAEEVPDETMAESAESARAWAESDDRRWSEHLRAFRLEPRLMRWGLPEPEARTARARRLARSYVRIMAAGYAAALVLLVLAAVLASRAFLIPALAVAIALALRWHRARPWPGAPATRKRLGKARPAD